MSGWVNWGNPLWIMRGKPSGGFYLYYRGFMETAVSGGLHAAKIRGSTGSYDFVNANGVLTASVSYTSGSAGLSILYWTANKVDISNYNTLRLYLDSVVWASGSTSQAVKPRFGILSATPDLVDLRDSWFVDHVKMTSGGDREYALDIAKYSGEYYIGFGLFAGSAQPKRANAVISSIWLSEDTKAIGPLVEEEEEPEGGGE